MSHIVINILWFIMLKEIIPLEKKKQVRNKTCWSWLSGIGRLCIGHCSFHVGLCLMFGTYFKPCSFSHSKGLEIKILFKELHTWAFCGQNVDAGWVKNDKKNYFHTSHLTPIPVFPENKVLKNHSLPTH